MNRNRFYRIIILLAIGIAGIVYLDSQCLLYYKNINGYAYDVKTYPGRVTTYTVRYLYEYEGKYYFDQKQFFLSQKVIRNDSVKLRIKKYKPSNNHFITDYNYPTNLKETKNTDKDFSDSIVFSVNKQQDFYPDSFDSYTISEKETIIYHSDLKEKVLKNVVPQLKRVTYSYGNLIDKYIFTEKRGKYELLIIYDYLNENTIDSKAMSIYQKLLRNKLDKEIEINVIDKNRINVLKKYAT